MNGSKEASQLQGREGTMRINYKDGDTKDVTRIYFDHPIWKKTSDTFEQDVPLDIQLELVNRCNLKCTACPIVDVKRDMSTLDWDLLKNIVDQAAEWGVCYFTLCGLGEASLHPRLFDLLGYIRSKAVVAKGLRTLNMMPSVLISNAMWNDRQVDECLANPPDLLSVSLAGFTDDEIRDRRRPINLERFYRTVARIYNERKVVRAADGSVVPIIHVSTHVYPYEMVGRARDEELFKEKWGAISDAIVIKTTMIEEGRVDPSHFAADKFSGSELGGQFLYTDLSKGGVRRRSPCFEVSRRLSINSDGEIWCGHHDSGDFGRPLGNVKSQSLKEIWHGEIMTKFRAETAAGIFHRPGCKACGGEIRSSQHNRP